MSLSHRIIVDKPHFKYRRETVLRRALAERLAAAATHLPSGLLLAIIEGWRPPHIQRRMDQAKWNRYSKDHPDVVANTYEANGQPVWALPDG